MTIRDFKHVITGLDQRASVAVQVADWIAGNLAAATATAEVVDNALIDVEAAATGEFQIASWALMNAAAATGTCTISAWASLIAAAATGTIQITDYTALAGKSFTVGGNTYTEGIHFVAETSDEVTATNLAAVLDLDADFTAAAGATDTVTITAAVAGVSGNSIGIATNAVSGVTLSGANLTGGRENGSIDVGGDTYYQGSDFTAETSNDVTAANLAAAIDAGAEVSAAAVGAVITITAVTAGAGGNGIGMTIGGVGLSISGANLTGGRDYATVTVGATTLTAGTDFTAETSNNQTATNLAAAIDALAAVTCVADTSSAEITAAATGEAGNAIGISFTGSGIAILNDETTLTGGVDGTTVTVGAETLTFGLGGLAKGGSITLTAENLKAAIHALADVNATRSGEVVTITAATAGEAGNAIALATDSAGIELSGATLEGGADAFVLTIDGNAITETTHFNAVTSNNQTATNLAAYITNTFAGYIAEAVGNVVTIWFETPGVGGNAKTITSSHPDALVVSAATFSGGVAATYTDAFDVAGAVKIEEQRIVTTLTGTNPTADVTPQFSLTGGDTWADDGTPFAQATGANTQSLSETFSGSLRRYKIVLGGTNPILTGRIDAIATMA